MIRSTLSVRISGDAFIISLIFAISFAVDDNRTFSAGLDSVDFFSLPETLLSFVSAFFAPFFDSVLEVVLLNDLVYLEFPYLTVLLC